MRCLYCDRSLGILRFRATEPFCSFEHRKLHYRNADPPVAKLLDTNPRLVDRVTAPAMEGWIPDPARQGRLEAWPSQTMGEPAVSSTGPLNYPIPAVAEVEFPKGVDRPAPVEFSSVVYIVPPGDEQLTAADLRDRMLRASETAIFRIALVTSSRPTVITYGPEFQTPSTSRPVSEPVRRAIECAGPPCQADFVAIGLVPAVGFGPSLVPAAGRFDPEGEVRFPAIDIQNVELPGCLELHSWAPCSDAVINSGIARLDPIRTLALSVLTLGPGRQAITDHCRPRPYRELQSVAAPLKDVSAPRDLIDNKKLTPIKGRFASVFAPVLPAFRARVPLQKTPHDAEHLT